MQLNLPPNAKCAPTDTRRRPDQRALENGDSDAAAEEKLRLEEKQRTARKQREENEIEYSPRWFTMENGAWMYNGEYWKERDEGNFTNIPDIY